jgi:salicylate hydroxylase
MLELVTENEVCEWKLRVHHPLKTWVEGNVALLGDACHPALPVRLGLLWLITEK